MPENNETIRILLVDDQQLLRQGLRVLLEMEPGIQVAGEAGNGQEAMEEYARLKPDVVLMDVRMPIMDGVEATRQMHLNWPGCRIIILTTFDDDTYVFDGLRAGALGYLLKDVSILELTQAIRTVNAGGALIEPSITRKVLAEFSRLRHETMASWKPGDEIGEGLSERELEILHLASEGMTNRQIAERLYLAEGTVKNYFSTIFQKMNVEDRMQAVMMAKRRGWI